MDFNKIIKTIVIVTTQAILTLLLKVLDNLRGLVGFVALKIWEIFIDEKFEECEGFTGLGGFGISQARNLQWVKSFELKKTSLWVLRG